jgi:hypothetical protein
MIKVIIYGNEIVMNGPVVPVIVCHLMTCDIVWVSQVLSIEVSTGNFIKW